MDKINAVNQLKKDKHSVLEGYITENLFKETFLSNTEYSSSWWVAEVAGKMFFFCLADNTNIVDRHVYELLRNENTWFVRYVDNKRYFYRNYTLFNEDEFLKEYKLKKKNQYFNAETSSYDISRQEKCIEYFEEKNIISDIAITRNFADDFLSVYFYTTVNIDFFTLKDNKLSILEIKYKFETKDGYFGINKGAARIFDYFREKKVFVYNCIFYNNTKNKNISVLEYLKTNEPKQWYMKKIGEMDKYKKSTAPSYTSIDGKKRQEFVEIPFSSYRLCTA